MRFIVCDHCHGTGQEPNVPPPHMCSRCPGSGLRFALEEEANEVSERDYIAAVARLKARARALD